MTIDSALARVRDFVSRQLAAGVTASAIAEAAGVDNKLVSMAAQMGWNPTAGTLRKFESLLPEGWSVGDPVPETAPKSSKARAAA